MANQIKHIAVMRLSAMGDVAMTVPVLRAFVKQYPHIKVTVISRAFFRPFFDGIPNLDFYVFDADEKHKGLLGLMRVFVDLQKAGIDAFADLHNVLRSKVVRVLFRLAGKKTAFLDKARAEKSALTRIENKTFRPLKPIVQRHADVFAKLGFPVDLYGPEYPKAPVPDKQSLGITGKKQGIWIGIAPFAQHDSKVYPLDMMQKVIDLLTLNTAHTILLFGGGKKEEQVLDRLASGKPNVINMAGKIKLKQELQLIANLDVMLSMDSGNAHIAAMLGIKVITLWGATHPFGGFMPFGQPADYALTADRQQYPGIPTSVYGNKKVEGYEDAMRTIPPEKVAAKITGIL